MKKIISEQGDQITGILMNIIDYNNGMLLTTTEYLAEVKKLAEENNVILIFDDILSCFKTGLTCGQGYYGVTPHLCTLAKAMTNDVPLGLVAGKKEIIDKIMDPVDPVISG